MNSNTQSTVQTAAERSPAKRPRKRFTQQIQRFDENGATQAFFDEQASYPTCSQATNRKSGIPSSTTRSAIGKLNMISMFPSIPFQQGLEGYVDRLKLQLVVGVPSNARVYCEKTAQGKKYYRVKYDLPSEGGKRRQESIYLGSDPDIAAWARDILTEKRYLEQRLAPRALDTERIQSLRTARDRLWKLARKITASTTFYFHGFTLRERRKEGKR